MVTPPINTRTDPRTFETSEFEARCLKLMDEAAETGEEIVITKHGRPVTRLVPYTQRPQLEFGRNRDRIQILGDIVSPTPAEWFQEEGDPGLELL